VKIRNPWYVGRTWGSVAYSFWCLPWIVCSTLLDSALAPLFDIDGEDAEGRGNWLMRMMQAAWAWGTVLFYLVLPIFWVFGLFDDRHDNHQLSENGRRSHR
jgi:hypothetical protein